MIMEKDNEEQIISIMINILINNDRPFYTFSSLPYHSCMFCLMYISIRKFTNIITNITIMDKYLDNLDYCTALVTWCFTGTAVR